MFIKPGQTPHLAHKIWPVIFEQWHELQSGFNRIRPFEARHFHVVSLVEIDASKYYLSRGLAMTEANLCG
jgi:hypothetical protein